MTLEDRIAEHFETDAAAVSALKRRRGYSENAMTYQQGLELVRYLIESLYGPFESSKTYVLESAKRTAYMIRDPDYGDIDDYLDSLTFPITDKYVYETARELARLHHGNKVEMPQVLQDWVNDEFFDPCSPNWPGTKPQDMDLEIVFLVLHLVQGGLHATRNEVTSFRTSACDAVAQAMQERGLKPEKYRGIEAIWKKRKKIAPGLFL